MQGRIRSKTVENRSTQGRIHSKAVVKSRLIPRNPLLHHKQSIQEGIT